MRRGLHHYRRKLLLNHPFALSSRTRPLLMYPVNQRRRTEYCCHKSLQLRSNKTTQIWKITRTLVANLLHSASGSGETTWTIILLTMLTSPQSSPRPVPLVRLVRTFLMASQDCQPPIPFLHILPGPGVLSFRILKHRHPAFGGSNTCKLHRRKPPITRSPPPPPDPIRRAGCTAPRRSSRRWLRRWCLGGAAARRRRRSWRRRSAATGGCG